MILTIEKKPLVSALSNLAKLVEKRNTLPVLGNVLVTTFGNDTVTLKATDLDIEATVTLECVTSATGATTVSAAMLLDIARKAPDGANIKLSHDKDTLTVSYGRSKFKLATLDAADFPVMASDEYDASFRMSEGELAYVMKPAFAMSSEETRYYLNGVYMHSTDDGVTSVATDGHKLAKCVIERRDEFPGVIIPRKTVALVKGILEPVDVSVSATKIKFQTADMVIVSKVVDGTFPDYSRVIPTGYVNSASVKGDDIRKASDRVATVSDGKARSVKLTLKDGSIGLSSRGGSDEANDEIDAEVNGEHLDIGVNAKYLADTMAECGGDSVTIKYKGASDPMLFTPDDDGGFMALLMPMRV